MGEGAEILPIDGQILGQGLNVLVRLGDNVVKGQNIVEILVNSLQGQHLVLNIRLIKIIRKH